MEQYLDQQHVLQRVKQAFEEIFAAFFSRLYYAF